MSTRLHNDNVIVRAARAQRAHNPTLCAAVGILLNHFAADSQRAESSHVVTMTEFQHASRMYGGQNQSSLIVGGASVITQFYALTAYFPIHIA